VERIGIGVGWWRGGGGGGGGGKHRTDQWGAGLEKVKLRCDVVNAVNAGWILHTHIHTYTHTHNAQGPGRPSQATGGQQ
jgi:hypothetical protein